MKFAGMLAMLLAMVIGTGGGYNGNVNQEFNQEVHQNEIVWLVMGSESLDNFKVFEEFNSKLEDKTGYKVSFKYIDVSQYDLYLAAGEEFDLILSPDWMGYWKNAEKGVFMPLSENDLKTNAPYIWENGKLQLDLAKVDGKYYAIPGLDIYAPDRVIVARGDLMDKVGVDSLDNIEDIDKFLMGVAKLNKDGETNIIPYNAPGSTPWMIFSMWASDWGWAAPGSLSFVSHYYYNIHDSNRRLFLAVDKPEAKEQSYTVKKWYDNGVFSKNGLSVTIPAEEAYKNGNSAFAWVSNPGAASQLYRTLKTIPAAYEWDTRFYSMYHSYQRAYNCLNTAVSVSATSKKKEAALTVLNAVYADKELYNLILYGIEGKHYAVNNNGEYVSYEKNSYLAPSMGIRNQEYGFNTKYDFSYAYDIVEELKSITVDDPVVNMPMPNVKDLARTKVILDDIYMDFTAPRMFGSVANVDEAIEKERNALVAASVERYIKEVQKAVDSYVSSHPEAEKNFKESLNAAKEYRKRNPDKVNPKDYK